MYIIKSFLILSSEIIHNHRPMMATGGVSGDHARQSLCSGPPVLPCLCHRTVKLKHLWLGFRWTCTSCTAALIMPLPPWCHHHEGPTWTFRAFSYNHTPAKWPSNIHYCDCPWHRSHVKPAWTNPPYWSAFSGIMHAHVQILQTGTPQKNLLWPTKEYLILKTYMICNT